MQHVYVSLPGLCFHRGLCSRLRTQLDSLPVRKQTRSRFTFEAFQCSFRACHGCTACDGLTAELLLTLCVPSVSSVVCLRLLPSAFSSRQLHFRIPPKCITISGLLHSASKFLSCSNGSSLTCSSRYAPFLSGNGGREDLFAFLYWQQTSELHSRPHVPGSGKPLPRHHQYLVKSPSHHHGSGSAVWQHPRID